MIKMSMLQFQPISTTPKDNPQKDAGTISGLNVLKIIDKPTTVVLLTV